MALKQQSRFNKSTLFFACLAIMVLFQTLGNKYNLPVIQPTHIIHKTCVHLISFSYTLGRTIKRLNLNGLFYQLLSFYNFCVNHLYDTLQQYITICCNAWFEFVNNWVLPIVKSITQCISDYVLLPILEILYTISNEIYMMTISLFTGMGYTFTDYTLDEIINMTKWYIEFVENFGVCLLFCIGFGVAYGFGL